MQRLAYLLLIVLSIVPVVVTAIVFAVAPETMPMHINFSGEITRYGSKMELLLVGGMWLFANALCALCYVFAEKLEAFGMLNAPGTGAGKIKTARILLLACIAFCDTVFVAVLVHLLFLA